MLFATYKQEAQRLHHLSVHYNETRTQPPSSESGAEGQVVDCARKLCSQCGLHGPHEESACDPFLFIAIRRDITGTGPESSSCAPGGSPASGVQRSPTAQHNGCSEASVHTLCWVGMVHPHDTLENSGEARSRSMMSEGACSCCGCAGGPGADNVVMKLASSSSEKLELSAQASPRTGQHGKLGNLTFDLNTCVYYFMSTHF
jgi:hypothetical protein